MTRSASPLPSPWLRTSWIFPTAAVRFYWVTWELTASWSSMVLYPKTQMALQGQTKTATEGFIGFLCRLNTVGQVCCELQGLTTEYTHSSSPSDMLLWYTENQCYGSLLHFPTQLEIYFHQIYGITSPWTTEGEQLDKLIPSLLCPKLLCFVQRMHIVVL